MNTLTDRDRARYSTAAILVTFCLGWAAACQGDDLLVDPPPNGTVLVTLLTTGGQPDPDGYLLIVDQGSPIEVAPSTEVSLTLATHTLHTIELTGLEANCIVSGANPRSVTVTGPGTTSVTFQVFCPGLSAITISTTTSGESQDSDGYLLTIDGVERGTLGPQQIRDIGSLLPGIHVLRLSSVVGNCSIVEGATRYVNLPEGATETVPFTVTCVPRIDDTPGERLVVSLRSAGDYDDDLYFMALDGRTSQRLTDNVGDEFSPEISPDGNRILFLQWAQGGRSLRVLDRVSRQETVLPTAGVDRAVWSPDGNSIAFIRGGRLFRMNSDGSGETPLTNGTEDWNPYWSPDGATIAFTRRTRVYLAKADGFGIRGISDQPRVSGPWSPDGRSILLTKLTECDFACYYYGPDRNPSDIVIFDVTSGVETPVTLTPQLSEWSPVWAADGQRIFFLFAPGGNPDVHAIRLDGGPAVNLSASPARESWISLGRVGGAAAP